VSEVIVSYLLDRGADTTIDRIRDTALETISPKSANGGPVLVYPTLVDLGGTGVIDLVDTTVTGPRDDRAARYDNYVLRDGKYVAVAPLDFYSRGFPASPDRPPSRRNHRDRKSIRKWTTREDYDSGTDPFLG
jgi:hypothetical protein